MRFLADQDVYAATVGFLRQAGHDVLTAAEAGQAQVSDIELLTKAMREERLLLTRDRDFGALVFVRRLDAGVVYLRAHPATLAQAHEELSKVLSTHTENALRHAFVVVEPGRHRFRKLPPL